MKIHLASSRPLPKFQLTVLPDKLNKSLIKITGRERGYTEISPPQLTFSVRSSPIILHEYSIFWSHIYM